jgi:hypothetical protein
VDERLVGERDAAVDVGIEALLSVLLLERLVPLRTNFPLCMRTTTSEPGRFSMDSETSSPMRSNASSHTLVSSWPNPVRSLFNATERGQWRGMQRHFDDKRPSDTQRPRYDLLPLGTARNPTDN